ncbi:hypothetical protein P8452_10057 [Trifolium repens]|nr:hypothetical protein P8452_10057 [Trifolium repens]
MVTPAALPIYPASSGYLPPMKWGEFNVVFDRLPFGVWSFICPCLLLLNGQKELIDSLTSLQDCSHPLKYYFIHRLLYRASPLHQILLYELDAIRKFGF